MKGMERGQELERILRLLIEGLKAELEYFPSKRGGFGEGRGSHQDPEGGAGRGGCLGIDKDPDGHARRIQHDRSQRQSLPSQRVLRGNHNRRNDEAKEKFMPRMVRLKMEHGRLRVALTR